MTEVTIWHNPRCSKSRQTLKLIEERGLTPSVRPYLTDPPSEAEIRAALKLLDIAPIELMRTGEAEFKALGLSRDSDPDILIRAMVSTPKLIERPVVFANGQARIGRPPEQVLDIL